MFAFFEKLIDPFAPHDESMPPRKLVPFILRYAKPVWRQVLWLMLIGLIVSLIEVALQQGIGRLVDALNGTNPSRVFADHLLIIIGGAIVLVGLRPFASFLHDAFVGQAFTAGLTNRIRWQNHRYVQRQSVNFFANDFAGRIASRIVQTGPAVRETVVKCVDAFWFVGIYSVSATVICFSIDYRLAIPMIFWNIGFVSVLRYFVPKIGACSVNVSHMRSLLTGRVVDGYTNIQTVKLFASPEREDNYVREALVRHTGYLKAEMRLISLLNLSINLLNGVMIFATGTLAIWFWSNAQISVGTVAIACGLTLRVSNMSSWIMWEAINIFDNLGQIQEGMETISKPNELIDRSGAIELAAPRGEIRFEHVRFHYGKKGGVIDDLSLIIRPGEKVGLVGRSGAGKSTIVNLLLRFYDVERGRVLIDGQNIADVTQHSLRQRIGLVTQDTSLLHRSITENIRYGQPEATMERVKAAARQAHAHEFIQTLTDPYGNVGYEAQVGERGVKLSGGQRQRIAIARVLLKDAPILVLDEATSALDSEVEAAIQESLYALMKGKTVIAIAHRLSTIAAMDRLIVMDQGEIVEMGTHDELLRRDGLYAGLWRRQSGGFLDLEAAE
ncbi:ABC transporter ATP-binding protein [Methylovirgula sp. 4M-Z18]|uniref:ABC transporter ATP-binding protein n=1 Tax=Methylovirgula sp. 4M-Z18 TaxID=2293567 RepID=UPI000E2FF069|nr:ABC transporter ATP-binding protein [Methylovirgula sp. 4M-Z18]RFB79123.1 ABC transporter ATP-binding protein [Methylovirgula sp. 4M-Z18]